jgi:hypothetical protein
MERIREDLIEFLDNIQNYERESGTIIGYDERESFEFVDIYLEGKISKLKLDDVSDLKDCPFCGSLQKF